MLRDIFIDNADQATITELNKYKRKYGSIYNFINSYKKMMITDRINTQLGWIGTEEQEPYYYVLDHCKEHIREMQAYSYEEGKDIPEDRNDHTINANQYAWIPFKNIIGVRI